MATKTHPGTKNVPTSADNPAAIEHAGEAHHKTLEGLGPIVVDPTPSTPGVQETKIHLKQRELWEKKGSRVPTEIPFKSLTWGGNVRPEEDLVLEPMIHSMKNVGYDPKYPLVVSKKAGGEFLVLNGNRRSLALKQISEFEPAIFDVVLPGKDHKVPALVFTGLTEDEEAIIRIDHGKSQDRVALSEHGTFLAVKQLVRAGYASQADIAAQLDIYKENPQTKMMEPNRSYIQGRVTLARLPEFMQEEYVKLMKGGKNATPVRWSSVPKLFKAYEPERRQGYFGETPDKLGPETKKAWKEATTPEAKDDKDGEEKDRSMTKSKLIEASTTLGSRLGKMFMLKVAGEDVKDTSVTPAKSLTLADIDGEMVMAEKAIGDLVAFRDELGEKKYDDLMVKITKSRTEAAKKAREAAEKAKAAE
jgi:hypothetical protein